MGWGLFLTSPFISQFGFIAVGLHTVVWNALHNFKGNWLPDNLVPIKDGIKMCAWFADMAYPFDLAVSGSKIGEHFE